VKRTPQQKTALFLERGGKCEHPSCRRKLRPGDGYYFEHVLALECGGTDDDDNLQIWCHWHKAEKDAKDHGQAGKQRQTATKHFLPGSQKHTRTRPMPGTKRSGWKQKVSGDWVRR
jgi:hypothetical protein